MEVKVEVMKPDGSMEHVKIDSQKDTISISMIFSDEENVDIVELLHGILKTKQPDVQTYLAFWRGFYASADWNAFMKTLDEGLCKTYSYTY